MPFIHFDQNENKVRAGTNQNFGSCSHLVLVLLIVLNFHLPHFPCFPWIHTFYITATVHLSFLWFHCWQGDTRIQKIVVQNKFQTPLCSLIWTINQLVQGGISGQLYSCQWTAGANLYDYNLLQTLFLGHLSGAIPKKNIVYFTCYWETVAGLLPVC